MQAAYCCLMGLAKGSNKFYR